MVRASPFTVFYNSSIQIFLLYDGNRHNCLSSITSHIPRLIQISTPIDQISPDEDERWAIQALQTPHRAHKKVIAVSGELHQYIIMIYTAGHR